MGKKKSTHFPSAKEVLDFIKNSATSVSRRDIAKAFNIKGGPERIKLKQLLKTLDEGSTLKRKSKKFSPQDALPPVTVLQISAIEPEGIYAALVTISPASPVKITVLPSENFTLKVGDKVLARLKKIRANSYKATILKKLREEIKKYVLGEIEYTKYGPCLSTFEHKKNVYHLTKSQATEFKEGDFVKAEIARGKGPNLVQSMQLIGKDGDPNILSQLVIQKFDLPHVFSDAAMKCTQNLTVPELGRREDLRTIPLVTIDGEDARDFDDAVWAEPDPKNPEGWHVIVAIADVAHYVQQGSALDEEAYERATSVYFPDRVVPMLPEELSNDLCSLKPNVDRASFAVHLWFDKDGNLLKHKFVRALIKSHARLTYRQVQDFKDGLTVDIPKPAALLIPHLYGAYQALKKARERRGTLDFERPEKKIIFGAHHTVDDIIDAPTYNSHKLIEEFMISANVAAAETLEKHNSVCLYRVHDQPDNMRVTDLRDFLKPLGFSLIKTPAIQPKHFTQLLKKSKGSVHEHSINDAVLRTQAQAVYSAENIGHFGLNLTRYSHFTSPIRRYSDLILHRLLLKALKIDDSTTSPEQAELQSMATHISERERNAAKAEWETVDRFMAVYLSNHIGEIFPARISGIVSAGLFLSVDHFDADGFIPVSSLKDDYYIFNQNQNAFVGRRYKRRYRIGDALQAQLVQADPYSNNLVFIPVIH